MERKSDQPRNEPKFPVIDGITVNIESIRTLTHECDPGLCSHIRSCCSSFLVCLDGKDMEKVIGFMPSASEYAPGLLSGGRMGNVFDELEPDLFSIDTDEAGLCAFAYCADSGETLCSLHTAAIDMDCAISDAKPRDCMLWPLALSETRPYLLSVDEAAFAFPCNTRRKAGQPGLDPRIEEIIATLFGGDFLREVYRFL